MVSAVRAARLWRLAIDHWHFFGDVNRRGHCGSRWFSNCFLPKPVCERQGTKKIKADTRDSCRRADGCVWIFAINFIGPNIAAKIWVFSDVGFYSSLSAGITVGLMIMPMMTTLSEDAMAAVPRALVEGAYALGATKRETCTGVIFPAALSGIIAAGVIAMSRAIGETTIVLLAAGSTANFTFDVGQPMQTMSSFIGFAGLGDQPTGSTGYQTIFAVGSLLFVITFILNMFSRKIVARFREVYE